MIIVWISPSSMWVEEHWSCFLVMEPESLLIHWRLWPMTMTYYLNLVAAHMDGNNQTDLVYGISASSTIIIFLNFNQSCWSEIISYEVNSDNFGKDVFVADLNDDGYSDLIILIYENAEVRAVLNNGNKTFATPATFFLAPECRPATLFVGQFNHDLYSDLVFISSTQQSFCIYLGNEEGTFSLSSIQSTTISDDVSAHLCADLNNDGLSDLVIAYYNSPSMDIFLHQNDALMTMAKFTHSNPLFARATNIHAADMNLDRHVDLVLASGWEGGDLVIIHGQGNGSFVRDIRHPTGISDDYMAMGDLNGDGTTDIAFAASGALIRAYTTLCCDSFHSTSTSTAALSAAPNFVTNGDFNQDNRTDLIVSFTGTSDLALMINAGDEKFDVPTVVRTQSNSYPIEMVAADVNNDGRVDLVLISAGEALIDVYVGDGLGQTIYYNRSYSIGASTQPRSLLVVNFDNDTHPDIIVTDDSTNSVGVLLGNGDGTFRPDWHLFTGYSSVPSSLAMGDFDEDGSWDLAVTLSGKNTIGTVSKQCGNWKNKQKYTIAARNQSWCDWSKRHSKCAASSCSLDCREGVCWKKWNTVVCGFAKVNRTSKPNLSLKTAFPVVCGQGDHEYERGSVSKCSSRGVTWSSSTTPGSKEHWKLCFAWKVFS